MVSTIEGGRNRDGTGWPHDKTETGRRTAAARRRTTAEQARGRRDQTRHQGQVISDGKEGEHCARGEGQEGSNDASEEWSGESTGGSEGSEMEEEATNAGGAEWGRETRTATAGGHAGKRHGRAAWGCAGRRGQHG